MAFNVLGVPAMAVPVGFSSTGLPLPMRLVAGPDGETTMFRVATAYQSATDWRHRTPPTITATGRETRCILVAISL